MKKQLFILPMLLLTLSLAGCNKGNKDKQDGDDQQEDQDLGEKNQTINFYIDYWHSETPYYTMEWYANKPLGSCPTLCNLTSANATDPLFPNFLGWSRYSSSIDDSKIWDFAKDAKTGIELNLYGIWVAD